MKLYEVPRNTKIKLKDSDGNYHYYLFHHVDGMYSYCTDAEERVVHFAAWAEVEIDDRVS